jgi:hypothetical protein
VSSYEDLINAMTAFLDKTVFSSQIEARSTSALWIKAFFKCMGEDPRNMPEVSEAVESIKRDWDEEIIPGMLEVKKGGDELLKLLMGILSQQEKDDTDPTIQ